MLHSICIPSAYLDKNTSYKIHDFITDTAASIVSRAVGNTVLYIVFRLLQSKLVKLTLIGSRNE